MEELTNGYTLTAPSLCLIFDKVVIGTDNEYKSLVEIVVMIALVCMVDADFDATIGYQCHILSRSARGEKDSPSAPQPPIEKPCWAGKTESRIHHPPGILCSLHDATNDGQTDCKDMMVSGEDKSRRVWVYDQCSREPAWMEWMGGLT